MKGAVRWAAPRMLPAAAVLAVWWAATTGAPVAPRVFPGPAAVAAAMAAAAAYGGLVRAAWTTMARMAVSFALAVAVGVPLGLCMGRSRRAGDLLRPAVLAMQSLPSFCWLPLVVLWAGRSEGAIIAVSALGAIFAIAHSVAAGVRALPPVYERAAATLGARGAALYREVIIPASLPSMVVGLKLGWAFGWRSLLAAELLFGNAGLGRVLSAAQGAGDVALVVGVILVLLALGVAVDQILFGRLDEALRRRWGYGRAAR